MLGIWKKELSNLACLLVHLPPFIKERVFQYTQFNERRKMNQNPAQYLDNSFLPNPLFDEFLFYSTEFVNCNMGTDQIKRKKNATIYMGRSIL